MHANIVFSASADVQEYGIVLIPEKRCTALAAELNQKAVAKL
jgi:hypothetical protein